MIEFFNKSNVSVSLSEEVIKSVLLEIASDFFLDIDYINIVFLSDEDLLSMNIEFLNHDYYTDILTFNYAETDMNIEAELYISTDRVAENAELAKDSFTNELSRVIIHGMLHLAGLTDSSSVLKDEMRKKENYYLDRISFHVKPAQ